ncbi:MAG: hypothetical protein Q4G44_07305 [Alcaligenaceae bacterium]|nr:hypothetical protein [Alcaligenaceae bacterium]
MDVVITIVFIGVVIGIIIGLIGGSESILASGLVGGLGAFGCMVQLILLVLPFVLGFWLIGAIFG